MAKRNEKLITRSIQISELTFSFKSVSIAYAEIERTLWQAYDDVRSYMHRKEKLSKISELGSIVALVKMNLINQSEVLNKKYNISAPTQFYENINYYEQEKNNEIVNVINEVQHIYDVANYEARKRNTGKWVGGGFGITGAIKGKIEADIMNSVSSAIDNIGNPMTFSKARREKERLVDKLINNILEDAKKLIKSSMELYNGCVDSVYPDTEIEPDKNKEQQILKQLEESNSDVAHLLIELIKNNPYEVNNYVVVYKKIIEIENCDEYEQDILNLIEMASWFNLDIKKWLKDETKQRIENLKITEEDLNQSFILIKIVADKEKEQKDLLHSLKYQCQHFLGNTDRSVKEIKEACKVIKKFDSENPEIKLIEYYQFTMKLNIRDAEFAIERGNEEADDLVKKVYAQKEIAQDSNYERLQKIEETFIRDKEKKILESLKVEDSDSVLEVYRRLLQLKEDYDYSADISKLEVSVNIFLSEIAKKIEGKQQLVVLEYYINKVEKHTAIRIESKKEIFRDAYQSACIVLGKQYATLEEAEIERKKVVGNQRYESEEEANKERERVQKEKEIENEEMRIVHNMESNNIDVLEILKEIRRRGFKSKAIKEKEQDYEQILIRQLNSYEGISGEIITYRAIILICGIIAAIVFVLGIIPFIHAGIKGKILLFVIFAIPAGNVMERGDDLKKLLDNKERKEEIESILKERVNEVKKCPYCGEISESGGSYCKRCGQKIR